MKERNLIIAAIAGIIGILLVGCSNEEYLGEVTPTTSFGQITFGSSAPKLTRSDAATAGKLGNNFVVWGTKTLANNETQTVFDNYQVNYVTNTAGTTTTNSADWEYINYNNVPDGVTTNVGVPAFSLLTGATEANKNGGEQTIKYWDFSATWYDFFAYSLGEGDGGETPTYAMTSAMTSSGYSITGNLDQLNACYISKKKTITSLSATATQVNLEFISFLSKIQMKFYETVPGYSVKDLKFYTSGAATTSTTTPALYAGSASLSIATGGTYNIGFDNNGNPLITSASSTTSTATHVSFDPTLTGYAGPEFRETDANIYLGRASNAATATEPLCVIPNGTGVALTLKMDYTLVSRDKSSETIHVKGAIATIPAAFTAWQPGYVYTYLFKITDNKLTPITFDAVIVQTADGNQETITTVSEPSITTYSKGQALTNNEEYTCNQNIYVVVENAPALTVGTNANLYVATLTNTKTSDDEDYHASPAQGITESTVASVLQTTGTGDPTTWSVTDANNWQLAVTTTGAPTLIPVSLIAADDAPEGVAILVNGAKFTPTAAGTYVFEYIDTNNNNKKYYKVIKVRAAPTP